VDLFFLYPLILFWISHSVKEVFLYCQCDVHLKVVMLQYHHMTLSFYTCTTWISYILVDEVNWFCSKHSKYIFKMWCLKCYSPTSPSLASSWIEFHEYWTCGNFHGSVWVRFSKRYNEDRTFHYLQFVQH
jgi:hypothetical protein